MSWKNIKFSWKIPGNVLDFFFWKWVATLNQDVFILDFVCFQYNLKKPQLFATPVIHICLISFVYCLYQWWFCYNLKKIFPLEMSYIWPPPRLLQFWKISDPLFIKTPVYQRPKSRGLIKEVVIRLILAFHQKKVNFIFRTIIPNVYESF